VRFECAEQYLVLRSPQIYTRCHNIPCSYIDPIYDRRQNACLMLYMNVRPCGKKGCSKVWYLPLSLENMTGSRPHLCGIYAAIVLLTFSDCFDNEAYMSNHWKILEVQIHTLWRQNCVGHVQWLLEKFVEVSSWDRDLWSTSSRVKKWWTNWSV